MLIADNQSLITDMYAWVIYDIRKNRVRQRVAKRCKFYGLARVQKSVFLGKIKGKWLIVMQNELSQTINQRTDRLFVVPMSAEAYKRVLQTGAPPPIQNSLDGGGARFI